MWSGQRPRCAKCVVCNVVPGVQTVECATSSQVCKVWSVQCPRCAKCGVCNVVGVQSAEKQRKGKVPATELFVFLFTLVLTQVSREKEFCYFCS